MVEYEFAILGAGALGSVLGAHLGAAGHRVVLLSRGERAREIGRQGLRIKGLSEFTQRVPVLTEASGLKGADVFIVATKTGRNAADLEPFRDTRIGAALSIQNGVLKSEQLAKVWGGERVLGALADTSAQLLPNGEVLFTRNERIYLGELQGGMSARAQRIAGLIDAAGVRCAAVANIESLEWSKFAAWVGMMVLSVTTRAYTWKSMLDADLALVLVRLIRSIGAIASARGIPLSDQSPLPVAAIVRATDADAVAMLQALGGELKAKAPEHRMSSLQDLESGRALELDDTIAHAVREAERLGLSLPTLDESFRLVAGIDRLRRS